MDITKLKRIGEAPEKGTYLIYTRNKVLFDSYDNIAKINGIIADNDILEVHLFDDTKEYRMLKSESKRFPDGIVEHIAEDKAAYDVYIDRTIIDNDKSHTLDVNNYIKYNENGMAQIDDYRLVLGGRG